jgi:TRAP-type uncharacterized transport system substrate-binding protein
MTMTRAIAAAGSLAALLIGAGLVGAAPLTETNVNRGVVELETMSASSESVRIGEDLANLVDDGATRRVLPIVGKGSLQNIIDLMALRGIDMAVLQIDVLTYVKQQNLFPGVDRSFTYITKLYNEEFHVLARRDIKTVADLAHQKVNVDVPGAGSGIIAQQLFGLLSVPVTPTNDDQGTAIEKLRRGEIAAVAFVTGKPAPVFQGLDGKDGLHFLSVPLGPAITAAYVPTRLTAEDYPGLVLPDQPVDTVAVGTMLAAANLPVLSDRYRNLVNFVNAFFTNITTLTAPGHHPKWREVNLAAEIPGWQRFPPAADWLQRNTPVASSTGPKDLKDMFMRFIAERQQAAGSQEMSQQQKDEMFEQFRRWQASQGH